MAIVAPPLSVAALRAELGLSLEAFAAHIGVSSKGRMSEIERGKVSPTAEQALRIEEISAGRVDAARLHPLIAAARAAGSVSRPAVCDMCERRASDPATYDCTAVDCGLRQQEAA